jgi:hypothetical protein
MGDGLTGIQQIEQHHIPVFMQPCNFEQPALHLIQIIAAVSLTEQDFPSVQNHFALSFSFCLCILIIIQNYTLKLQ